MRRFFLAALLFAPAILFGDGGTLQLRKPAGPWIVTVFSTPVPLRAGVADLSVMVQTAQDRKTVLDAGVKLHLTKSSATDVVEIIAPATRSQATNKLLYAARVTLPSAGKWRLEVDVKEKASVASVSGEIAVLPLQPPAMARWPYFAFVLLVVLLFAMNQWLKRSRRLRRPRARP